MDILKALGIILVVMGHKHQPQLFFYPAYSFHMALFIFASGYFYKVLYEENLPAFFKSKLSRLLIPYFIFNAFYAVLTYLLYLNYGIKLGQLPTWKNFFLEPFVSGHQYHLYLAAWFVPYLFLIQVTFLLLSRMIKKLNKNDFVHLFFFLLLAVLGLFIAANEFNIKKAPITLVSVRMAFGLFFFYLGYFFRERIEKLPIFKSGCLVMVLTVQAILIYFFEGIDYFLVWGDFKGHIFLPIFATINGIYIYLFIAKALSKLLKPDDFIYKIGENSYHIMSHHLFIFFIINFIIVKAGGFDISTLGKIWFAYEVKKYWFIYVIPGVVIPTIIAIAGKKVRVYLKERKLSVV